MNKTKRDFVGVDSGGGTFFQKSGSSPMTQNGFMNKTHVKRFSMDENPQMPMSKRQIDMNNPLLLPTLSPKGYIKFEKTSIPYVFMVKAKQRRLEHTQQISSSHYQSPPSQLQDDSILSLKKAKAEQYREVRKYIALGNLCSLQRETRTYNLGLDGALVPSPSPTLRSMSLRKRNPSSSDGNRLELSAYTLIRSVPRVSLKKAMQRYRQKNELNLSGNQMNMKSSLMKLIDHQVVFDKFDSTQPPSIISQITKLKGQNHSRIISQSGKSTLDGAIEESKLKNQFQIDVSMPGYHHRHLLQMNNGEQHFKMRNPHRTIEVYNSHKPRFTEIRPLTKKNRNHIVITNTNRNIGQATSPLGSYQSHNSQMSLLMNEKQKQIVYSQLYYDNPATPELHRHSLNAATSPIQGINPK